MDKTPRSIPVGDDLTPVVDARGFKKGTLGRRVIYQVVQVLHDPAGIKKSVGQMRGRVKGGPHHLSGVIDAAGMTITIVRGWEGAQALHAAAAVKKGVGIRGKGIPCHLAGGIDGIRLTSPVILDG